MRKRKPKAPTLDQVLAAKVRVAHTVLQEAIAEAKTKGLVVSAGQIGGPLEIYRPVRLPHEDH